MRRARHATLAIAAACALIVTAGCTEGATTNRGSTAPPGLAMVRAASSSPSPTAKPTPSASVQLVDRTLVFGKSVRGASLTLTELGDPRRPSLLVVGCIHGSESAGIAVVDALFARGVPAGAHLWLVPTLNPDGQAADQRTNADGVDLNRNFPYHWQRLQRRGAADYSGASPLSEPESQAMAALLRRVHPTVGVWFHQSLNVIDVSQGPRAVEDQLSAALQVKEMSLVDYPGSAIGYEDALVPRSAFAFELPPGTLTSARARQVAAAIVTVASTL